MKKYLFNLIIFAATLAAFSGCHIENDFGNYDNRPPSPPANIYTVTGDNRVDLTWDENSERDVAGYNIYYSTSYNGKYTLIGSSETNYYIDYGAENGVTCYYAVTAYDYDGNESELSEDVVYDTPRPEGFNQAIYDYLMYPSSSGYDFSSFAITPYDDDKTDFFFENYQGEYYLNVWNDSDIQDMGPTRDIYDIDRAPENGWSTTKDVRAAVGHTYVIWTWDNHFAKIRIKNITRDRVVFDWAYQSSNTEEGYRELKTSGGAKVRTHINAEVLKSRPGHRNP